MTVLGSSDRAPDVYFPMEIIAREYAGHLLLAARLAGEGINVIIGHKVPVKSLTRSASEPGVIFYKSSPPETILHRGRFGARTASPGSGRTLRPASPTDTTATSLQGAAVCGVSTRPMPTSASVRTTTTT